MSVTLSGLSGLTNAYTSVLSARGSPAINGASRWLDAVTAPGPALMMNAPLTSARPAAPATPDFHFLLFAGAADRACLCCDTCPPVLRTQSRLALTSPRHSFGASERSDGR